MYYSLVYNTCLCRRYTLIWYSVYVVYLYVMSLVCVLYSVSLCYYMHLYSCRGLDLILCDSIGYTVVLYLYMYLYISDCLILRDCYIFICLVCILVCVLSQVLEVCQTSNTCLISSVALFGGAVKWYR